MSKIVCDVCGSTYSETEAQCPICGTAKSEAAKLAVETAGEDAATKGGKFSKNNNRKNGPVGGVKKPGQERTADSREEGTSINWAMVAIVAVLLIVIIAVAIFIVVDRGGEDPTDPGSTPGTSSTTPPVVDVPCTGLELVGMSGNTLSFSALTESAQLNVKPVPENTTEDVVCTYTSSNESVVLVDQTGLVTPVANGTATITVAYGSHSLTVDVTCDIPAPITELKLLSYGKVAEDVTLSPANGLSLTLTVEGLDASDVTWTSEDESVVIVENGVVTAVSNNPAGVKITATYGDLTATCLVRVKDMKESAYLLTTGYTSGTEFSVYLTLGSDESFLLKFINKETQEEVTGIEWDDSPDFVKCCTMTKEGNGIRITAIATTYSESISGNYVKITVTYQNETYTCKIFVKEAAATE